MTGPLGMAAFALLAFAVGAALGWLFYAGLYHTVRGLHRARRPALLLGASLLVRMAVLLTGLWLVLQAGSYWMGGSEPGNDGGWLALVPALLGLLLARGRLLRRCGRSGRGSDEPPLDGPRQADRQTDSPGGDAAR